MEPAGLRSHLSSSDFCALDFMGLLASLILATRLQAFQPTICKVNKSVGKFAYIDFVSKRRSDLVASFSALFRYYRLHATKQ